MRREMKSIRQIENGAGAMADRVGLSCRVRFEPLDTQEPITELPELDFGLGNLRFEDADNLQPSLFAEDSAPSIVEMDGAHTSILLHGPHAFALVTTFKEIQIRSL